MTESEIQRMRSELIFHAVLWEAATHMKLGWVDIARAQRKEGPIGLSIAIIASAIERDTAGQPNLCLAAKILKEFSGPGEET